MQWQGLPEPPNCRSALSLQGQISKGTFAAYAPLAQEVELCDIPDDDDAYDDD